MPCGIRIRRIRCGSGLLHSGNRDESQSMRDEEHETLVNRTKSKPIDGSDPDLYMEAHRNRVGKTALRNSPFACEPDQVSIGRDAVLAPIVETHLACRSERTPE
jgi:hypothetical protein